MKTMKDKKIKEDIRLIKVPKDGTDITLQNFITHLILFYFINGVRQMISLEKTKEGDYEIESVEKGKHNNIVILKSTLKS